MFINSQLPCLNVEPLDEHVSMHEVNGMHVTHASCSLLVYVQDREFRTCAEVDVRDCADAGHIFNKQSEHVPKNRDLRSQTGEHSETSQDRTTEDYNSIVVQVDSHSLSECEASSESSGSGLSTLRSTLASDFSRLHSSAPTLLPRSTEMTNPSPNVATMGSVHSADAAMLGCVETMRNSCPIDGITLDQKVRPLVC